MTAHKKAAFNFKLNPAFEPNPEHFTYLSKAELEVSLEDQHSSLPNSVIFTKSRVVAGAAHPYPLAESRVFYEQELPPLEEEIRVENEIPRRVVLPALAIPQKITERLSSPQLETVVYAVRRFSQTLGNGHTGGFLLGDGTGCGKGRTIAAIILHFWNLGKRHHVWISQSNDLIEDARRDLNDLLNGTDIDIPLINLQHHNYTSVRKAEPEGVLFTTYSMMVSEVAKSKRKASEFKSRADQIIDWMGKSSQGADGILAFDEAHKAKGLIIEDASIDEVDGKSVFKKAPKKAVQSSKTGKTVHKLQLTLRNAPVLYSTATGATSVKQMGYMTRLGLWGFGTPHRRCADFCKFIETGGMISMELVALQLRSSGIMSAKQLSFEGAEFETLTVPLVSQESIDIYDNSVKLWQKILLFVNAVAPTGKAKYQSQFWGTQQRFFKQILVSLKIDEAVARTRQALEDDYAVVISLWSTGESRINDKAGNESEFSDMYSGPYLMIEHFLESMLTAIKKQWQAFEFAKISQRVTQLIQEAKDLNLPINPLDRLIYELGGGSQVAELTGRKKRIVAKKQCSPDLLQNACEFDKDFILVDRHRELKCPVSKTNIVEQNNFQHGVKRVAIITEAASAGISLHSDQRDDLKVENRRRIMICLELPWAADKAVQQFGRIHRSNQAFPPIYRLLVTDAGGESRFVSTITLRLRMLGAMTRADRSCTISSQCDEEIQEYDIHNKYGVMALQRVEVGVKYGESPNLLFGMYAPDFIGEGLLFENWDAFRVVANREIADSMIFENTGEKKDEVGEAKTITRFLNRLLMCSVKVQNVLYQTFTKMILELVEAAKERGDYDTGMSHLSKKKEWSSSTISIQDQELLSGLVTDKTYHTKLLIDRGCSWQAALNTFMSNAHSSHLEGFYEYFPHTTGKDKSKRFFVLASQAKKKNINKAANFFLTWPHIGFQTTYVQKEIRAADLQGGRFSKIHNVQENLHVIQRGWEEQYQVAANSCQHIQHGCTCERTNLGIYCPQNRRTRMDSVLHGNILNSYTLVQAFLTDTKPQTPQAQSPSSQTNVPGQEVPKVSFSVTRVNVSLPVPQTFVAIVVKPDDMRDIAYILKSQDYLIAEVPAPAVYEKLSGQVLGCLVGLPCQLNNHKPDKAGTPMPWMSWTDLHSTARETNFCDSTAESMKVCKAVFEDLQASRFMVVSKTGAKALDLNVCRMHLKRLSNRFVDEDPFDSKPAHKKTKPVDPLDTPEISSEDDNGTDEDMASVDSDDTKYVFDPAFPVTDEEPPLKRTDFSPDLENELPSIKRNTEIMNSVKAAAGPSNLRVFPSQELKRSAKELDSLDDLPTSLARIKRANYYTQTPPTPPSNFKLTAEAAPVEKPPEIKPTLRVFPQLQVNRPLVQWFLYRDNKYEVLQGIISDRIEAGYVKYTAGVGGSRFMHDLNGVTLSLEYDNLTEDFDRGGETRHSVKRESNSGVIEAFASLGGFGSGRAVIKENPNQDQRVDFFNSLLNQMPTKPSRIIYKGST